MGEISILGAFKRASMPSRQTKRDPYKLLFHSS